MKVCFVSFEYPPKTFGGAGTYAGFLVKGLKDKGIEVYTITTGDLPEKKIYRIQAPNISYWRRLFFMKSATSLLYKLDKRFKFDLVHFNEPYMIARSSSIPSLCTFHSSQANEIKMAILGLKKFRTVRGILDLTLKNPVGSLFDIVTAHMVDEIICPCFDLAKLLESYCFVNEQKIHVVPNGIDLESFDKIGYETDFLEKYGIEKENFLLYMGRLVSWKGIEYLIEAFKNLKKEYANLKLVIVGNGDFEPYLRNFALGIKDILFVGFIDSLIVKNLLYESCLTLVVPSLLDSMPMVVLEAMARNKPVVASDVGSIPLMIKHEKNGFLVKPADSKSLEKSIKLLYENPDLRKRMGSFGRKLVEKEFTIDKMISNTIRVYESLL